LIIQLIYFKVCRCIYRILSYITWGINKYRTILQLIKQLIHFRMCSCIYRIISNITWRKYEYGIILHLKIHLILVYIRVCRTMKWDSIIGDKSIFMRSSKQQSAI